MMHNIIDMLELEHAYREYLLSQGVMFDDNGHPIFEVSMFLDEWPEAMVTFQCRNNKTLVKNPKKTVLCFFTADSRILPRLEKVFSELDEYKRFMAVVSMDLTITDDMDPELQQLIFTINLMFTMILAINGIKIVLNTRSGGLVSTSIFKRIPMGVTVASGFLGCNRLQENDFSYVSKIVFLMPSRVLIYGKHDPIAEEQLDRLGLSFKNYPDTHRLTKYKEKSYG